MTHEVKTIKFNVTQYKGKCNNRVERLILYENECIDENCYDWLKSIIEWFNVNCKVILVVVYLPVVNWEGFKYYLKIYKVLYLLFKNEKIYRKQNRLEKFKMNININDKLKSVKKNPCIFVYVSSF